LGDDGNVRYSVDLAGNVLRTPHKVTQGLIARDLLSWVRVEFLGTASGLGLLEALGQPRTEVELASELGVSNDGLLRALLDLGAALGELQRSEDRWALHGSRAKALVDPAVEGLAGLVEEAATYDADVYRALRGRLRGEPSGDYLPDIGPVVARASRAAEPVLAALVRNLVHRLQPRRVLDVGCGTGVYLRHAAEASPRLAGVGIEIDPGVVEVARRNVTTWGLTDRVEVYQADLRTLPPELQGPWDLILLFQNIYYFPTEERRAVLARLRKLAPNGVVAVATVVASASDPIAAHLDLVLRSTAGNYPLPSATEVPAALRAAGYATIDERSLAPGQPLRAFIAS
jgi:SAM-dependent methyltransferase